VLAALPASFGDMATALGAVVISTYLISGIVSSPSVKLNNGVDMPLIAFGANFYPQETCKQATAWALQAGIRFIWSSEIIGEPCQRAQRQAIDSSGVPRKDIYLAGTVDTSRCTGLQGCYQATKTGCEGQFAALGPDPLDMLMLDYPSSAGCDGIRGQWKAFQEFATAGKVKTLAVSNFDEGQIQCVLNMPGATQPAVNQMKYNVGFGQNQGVVAENKHHGVVLQAYSPLGTGSVLKDPVLQQIGKKYGKSAAQVALRWLLHQGVAVNVASTNLEHLREDASVFDFDLDENDMSQLSAHFQPAVQSKAEA